MANKLKELQVTKVDFVDAGANPEANIMLFKRKPEQAEGAAETRQRAGGFFRSVIAAIAKSVGATEEQIDAAMEEIAKGGDAATFGEKMAGRQLRRTADEIWDFCYALQESLCSILMDQDVPAENKPALMTQSCAEFTAAVTTAIPKWATGVPTKVEKAAAEPLTEERLQIAKEARARLDEAIQKAEPAKAQSGAAGGEPEGAPNDTQDDGGAVAKSITEKGEQSDMKIDKSKLSAEELAALEAIEKKAGIPEDTTPAPETDPVAKGAPAAPAAGEGTEDIYKGMHPAVAEELRSLRKFREETEDREILAVAKKYELLGKKPEELAAVLKSLKAAGGTAYADMIGVLDANLAVVQQSPAFTEVGKRGGTAPANDADAAWAQIEKKAEEIRKSAPTMSFAESIDKACEQNPDLVHQYEQNR